MVFQTLSLKELVIVVLAAVMVQLTVAQQEFLKPDIVGKLIDTYNDLLPSSEFDVQLAERVKHLHQG